MAEDITKRVPLEIIPCCDGLCGSLTIDRTTLTCPALDELLSAYFRLDWKLVKKCSPEYDKWVF